MSQAGGAFSEKTRGLIWGRARGRCEICGIKTEHGQYHHRKPRRMGGTSDESLASPENGLYLHFLCHERVERNRATSYLMGYLVAAVDNPREVPVRLWDGWWMLDDDGSLIAASAAGVSGEASSVAEVNNAG